MRVAAPYTNTTATADLRPTLQLSFRGHRQSVLSLAFQPPARAGPCRLLSGGADGAVLLWDPSPTSRALRLVGHRGPVLGVAHSPKALLVASVGHDGHARLWVPDLRRSTSSFPGRQYQVDSADPEQSASCAAWRAHGGAARAVGFSRDGSDLLFTAGDDKSVKMWDLRQVSSTGSKFVGSFSGTARRAGSAHTNSVHCLALPTAGTVVPFAHLLASGGEDRALVVWDTRTRQPAHAFYEAAGGVRAVGFHPDGHVVAGADSSGALALYDLRRSSSGSGSEAGGGRRYGLLQHYPHAHDGAVNAISFAPSGAWLLSAGEDSTAKVWDLREGRPYCTVRAHEGPLRACAFSEDGESFATGGRDKVVLLWRAGLPALRRRSSQPSTSPEEEGEEVAGMPAPPPWVVDRSYNSANSTTNITTTSQDGSGLLPKKKKRVTVLEPLRDPAAMPTMDELDYLLLRGTGTRPSQQPPPPSAAPLEPIKERRSVEMGLPPRAPSSSPPREAKNENTNNNNNNSNHNLPSSSAYMAGSYIEDDEEEEGGQEREGVDHLRDRSFERSEERYSAIGITTPTLDGLAPTPQHIDPSTINNNNNTNNTNTIVKKQEEEELEQQLLAQQERLYYENHPSSPPPHKTATVAAHQNNNHNNAPASMSKVVDESRVERLEAAVSTLAGLLQSQDERSALQQQEVATLRDMMVQLMAGQRRLLQRWEEREEEQRGK